MKKSEDSAAAKEFLCSASTQMLLCLIVIWSCSLSARGADYHCIFPVLRKPEKTSSEFHAYVTRLKRSGGGGVQEFKKHSWEQRNVLQLQEEIKDSDDPQWSDAASRVNINVSKCEFISITLIYTYISWPIFDKKNKAASSFWDFPDFWMCRVADDIDDWWERWWVE